MRISFIPSFILGVSLILLTASSSLFTLHQTKKALVLQFGELVKIHDTPGLKVKIPVIQDVIFFDRRLLDYNLPVIEVNSRYRILSTQMGNRVGHPGWICQSRGSRAC